MKKFPPLRLRLQCRSRGENTDVVENFGIRNFIKNRTLTHLNLAVMRVLDRAFFPYHVFTHTVSDVRKTLARGGEDPPLQSPVSCQHEFGRGRGRWAGLGWFPTAPSEDSVYQWPAKRPWEKNAPLTA